MDKVAGSIYYCNRCRRVGYKQSADWDKRVKEALEAVEKGQEKK